MPAILVIRVACKEKVTGVMQPAVDQIVKLCLEVWFTQFQPSSICAFGWKPIASWVDVYISTASAHELASYNNILLCMLYKGARGLRGDRGDRGDGKNQVTGVMASTK